jgi:aminoglycoside phosphotransferase (APT) family kinase protein
VADTAAWIAESRALRASVPSPDGLARLADALGEPVELVGPLHGGVASSVHELQTPTRRLVLKRYRADDEPPPLWELEWERLHLVAALAIPTPAPVAYDPDGTWFGRAALVMAHLPGAVAYPPAVESMARTLATLHASALPEPVPDVLRRPGLWTKWVQTAPGPPGMLEVLAALAGIASAATPVLCHCDFHPGNVLVVDGEVSAVVDWSGVRLAPRGFDVALTRCDLAITPGGDAPDRFLAAYEAASGVRLDDLAAWDVLASARAIEHGAGWVDAWTEVGVAMTADQILERATAFCEAALS